MTGRAADRKERRRREGKERYRRTRKRGWVQTDRGGGGGLRSSRQIMFQGWGRLHTLGPLKVTVHPLPCKQRSS